MNLNHYVKRLSFYKDIYEGNKENHRRCIRILRRDYRIEDEEIGGPNRILINILNKMKSYLSKKKEEENKLLPESEDIDWSKFYGEEEGW